MNKKTTIIIIAVVIVIVAVLAAVFVLGRSSNQPTLDSVQQAELEHAQDKEEIASIPQPS